MSFLAMDAIWKTVEGAPAPPARGLYEIADVARFREWWKKEKDNLRFKNSPPPP